MTKVSFTRDKYRWTIDIEGHANYAVHGQDIVCSAISLLTHMISQYLIDNEDCIQISKNEMASGEAHFEFVSSISVYTPVVMRQYMKGFAMIAESYPNYCSLTLNV